MSSLRYTRCMPLALAFACLLQAGACAEGALAVGFTDNVSKDGFAYGRSWGVDSVDTARSLAIKNCRDFKTARTAAAQCRLVGTFANQCVTVAMDPKAGTPGVGWAIAPTKEEAEQRAMADCQATAGAARKDFCAIDNTTRCDGSAR